MDWKNHLTMRRLYAFSIMRNKGFTLIELSIVLVIIALITSGILVGRELIATATLRKIASQSEQIKGAINTFKIRFQCLPGDCAKASEFFPTAQSDPNAINGNGDGSITGTDLHETFAFWQQLNLAGLIDGTYTGTFDTAAIGLIPPQFWNRAHAAGVNIPRTPAGDYSGYCAVNNIMILARASRRIGAVYHLHPCDEQLFFPLQAQYIDTKMDDGAPLSGKMIADEGDYRYGSTVFGDTNPEDCYIEAENRYNIVGGRDNGCIIRLENAF